MKCGKNKLVTLVSSVFVLHLTFLITLFRECIRCGGSHIGLKADELLLLIIILQVNLVDWLKMMVGSRRSEEVVDPTIDTKPSTRALKRALLTALRCVDPDSDKRPRMSQVVRMLESEEYPLPREVSCPIIIFLNVSIKK